MTTSKLHHLALGARNVDLVASFYRDVLGLTEITRHHHADGTLRSVWLDLGGATLMVEQTHERPRLVDGVGSGPFLLALRVDAKERHALEGRLAAAGAHIEYRSPFTSYARDPEGNRVAISHHPHQPVEPQ
ncbi:MAG: VOC family protein [Myxococcota bacterium]